jgi:uncharacterized protein with FMN-binding domain
MGRAPIVIGGTVLGLAGVLGFHPRAERHPSMSRVVSAAQPASTARAASATRTARAKPAPSARAAAAATKTATGADAPNQYGDVQVRVTVAGGKITRVTAVALPFGDPKSQEISSFAGPQLAQEALAAQSAQIQGISGASYTSQSYATSLQSALDKVGFRA